MRAVVWRFSIRLRRIGRVWRFSAGRTADRPFGKLTREQQWDRMPELVDDKMLDAFVPSATYENVSGLLEQWYGDLTDTITFPMPEDARDDEECRQVVAALRGGSPHNA